MQASFDFCHVNGGDTNPCRRFCGVFWIWTGKQEGRLLAPKWWRGGCGHVSCCRFSETTVYHQVLEMCRQSQPNPECAFRHDPTIRY